MSVRIPKGRKHYVYEFQIDGVRFRRGTGQANREAAKRIEAKARTAAALALAFPARAGMTLNVAFSRYYREVAARQPSAATTDYQLARLLAGLGKGTPLAGLATPSGNADLALYVARRRAQVADASVNRELELLRRVWRRADRVWKAAVGDPPDWRALALTEPAPRARELGAAEEAALLAALRPDFHGFVGFALLTGLRLSAVIRLTWHQVDLQAAVIRVRGKSRRPGGTPLELPVTRAMGLALRAERGRHPIYVFTYECRRSRRHRRRGQRYPFSKNGWRRDWAAALATAGIADFRYHDTRHTAATRTLRATGNLKLVKEMLGHADIMSTARYAHVLTDDLRAGMEAAQAPPARFDESKSRG